MQPTPPMIEYVSLQRSSNTASVVIADVLGGLVLGGLLVAAVLWRRVHQRNAAAAREAEQAGQQLRPGVTVVSGRVATDGTIDRLPDLGGGSAVAEGAAVTIEIDQVGRERRNKQGYFVTWTETARRVAFTPFYIVRSGGDRVRVEPDSSIFLVDQLDGTNRTAQTRRTRTAALTPGETVHASGTLVRGNDPQAGGYRDGGIGWVLRPIAGARMLISTEPQAARHERRVRFHRGWAIALWIFVGVIHGGLFGTFHLLEAFGTVVEARVVDTSTYRTWVKPRHSSGYWQTHYVLDAEYQAGGERHAVRDEIRRTFYDRVQRDRQEPVPFRVMPSLSLAQVGPVPTVDTWKLAISCVVYLLLLILYPVIAASSRPWYDKKRVVETVKGRL